MMSITHAAFSVSLTSIVLGTANPEVLVVSVIASLLPDIDTSKSFIGRLFFPLSRWIETRTVHRGITHSFFATGVITLVTYPLAAFGYSHLWKALILGYFWGWFADVFTKSGVEAFYPSRGRLIIPRNPHLRLGTRSRAEWFLLMVLVAIADLEVKAATLEAARAELERQREEEKVNLSEKVLKLVLDYEAAQRQIQLVRSQLITFNQQQEILRIRYRLGEGDTSQFMESQVRGDGLEAQLVELERQRSRRRLGSFYKCFLDSFPNKFAAIAKIRIRIVV